MAANTAPIFGRIADVQIGGAVFGPTAVTAQDGTGALLSIFQSDTTEGSFVEEIRLKPVGSPVATVCRIFVCSVTGTFTSGTSNTVVTTAMVSEMSLSSVTTSNNSAQNDIAIPFRKALPPGWRLLIGFGTSTGAAGTGWVSTVFGSKY
ncbi:MAG TPA: hypothetical protein VF598_08720 [Hymenobacter sp.]|jgi:hypothetical protein